MKEFGSDFHYCLDFTSDTENELSKLNASFYANGRLALKEVIEYKGWERIWVPSYFCHEIVDSIKRTGINVELYSDAPLFEDQYTINQINFKNKDVLLRMNYFGLRGWRDNSQIPVPVIEDHSHDLVGEWARFSNADWCFASLRKTLPLPEGGILWSPKNLPLPKKLKSSIENELVSYKRLSAMLMKTLYLSDINVSKDIFRQTYIQSEEELSELKKSNISDYCMTMFKSFNINDWYKKKSSNWIELSSIAIQDINVLIPEDIEKSTPFSLVLQFKNKNERELIRKKLMENNIFPAVLWELPKKVDNNIVVIGEKLLSIHCDGRYNLNDIDYLKETLIKLLGVKKHNGSNYTN